MTHDEFLDAEKELLAIRVQYVPHKMYMVLVVCDFLHNRKEYLWPCNKNNTGVWCEDMEEWEKTKQDFFEAVQEVFGPIDDIESLVKCTCGQHQKKKRAEK